MYLTVTGTKARRAIDTAASVKIREVDIEVSTG